MTGRSAPGFDGLCRGAARAIGDLHADRTRGASLARRRAGPLRAAALALLALQAGAEVAAAQFAVGGRTVAPVERNFAGVRQASPRYGLVVQINHDVHLGSDLDLGLLDDIYAGLYQQFPNGPVVRADALTLVVTTEEKIARFGEGGRRRIFRMLEADLARHRDLHLSPTAIFVAGQALAHDGQRRAVLTRALAWHFDQRFREAVEQADRLVPDRQ